jgi:peroxiredoxin
MATNVGRHVPDVDFMVRVRDESIGGSNPYRWESVNSQDFFKQRRVVLFSLPGAFTPTCSNQQLPGFEKNYDEFVNNGIDSIYCMSVNDSFVMNAWFKSQNVEKVVAIPDGNGQFTFELGMLVSKMNLGFGERSWRYVAIIDDGVIEAWFEEPGIADDVEEDPYGDTSPENILEYLRQRV